jgi:hypothetical protein
MADAGMSESILVRLMCQSAFILNGPPVAKCRLLSQVSLPRKYMKPVRSCFLAYARALRLTRSVLFVLSGILTFGWHASSLAAIPQAERDALIALYTNTNGDQWRHNTGWCDGPCPATGTPKFNAPGTECQWYGVHCNTPARNPPVTDIELDQNNLVGILPALNSLTALEYFDVHDNHLEGAIPTLAGLVALRAFAVSDNQLSGSIPSLSGLTSLRVFAVYHNQLTGPIPNFSGLSALEDFVAWGNQLSGEIPVLKGATSLKHFQVFSNRLAGSIPSLDGLPLESFLVARNQLKGEIPRLAGLKNLKNFGADGNRLTGSIPPLAGLTALELFDVSGNDLSGPLPSLSGLTALTQFRVEMNRLTGKLPAAPSGLIASGDASLCPNHLDTTPSAVDADWNKATRQAPRFGIHQCAQKP